MCGRDVGASRGSVGWGQPSAAGGAPARQELELSRRSGGQSMSAMGCRAHGGSICCALSFMSKTCARVSPHSEPLCCGVCRALQLVRGQSESKQPCLVSGGPRRALANPGAPSPPHTHVPPRAPVKAHYPLAPRLSTQARLRTQDLPLPLPGSPRVTWLIPLPHSGLCSKVTLRTGLSWPSSRREPPSLRRPSPT